MKLKEKSEKAGLKLSIEKTKIMASGCITSSQVERGKRRNNNLRYADDTTLLAESEELKSLLMKVKEESEKVGLNLNS